MMQSSAGPFVSRLFFNYMQSQVDILAARCEKVWLGPHVALCRRVLVRHLCSKTPRFWHFWACPRAVLQSMHSMLELSQLNAEAEEATAKRQRAILRYNFRQRHSDWNRLQQWLCRCDRPVPSNDVERIQSILWLHQRIVKIQETQHRPQQEGSAAEPSNEAVTQLRSEVELRVHSGLVDLFASNPALLRAQQDLRTAARTALLLLTSCPDDAAAALPSLDDEPWLRQYDYETYPEGVDYGIESDLSEDGDSSQDSDSEDLSGSSYHSASSDFSSDSEQDDSENSEEHDDSEVQDDSQKEVDSEEESDWEEEDNSEEDIDSDEEAEQNTDEEHDGGQVADNSDGDVEHSDGGLADAVDAEDQKQQPVLPRHTYNLRKRTVGQLSTLGYVHTISDLRQQCNLLCRCKRLMAIPCVLLCVCVCVCVCIGYRSAAGVGEDDFNDRPDHAKRQHTGVDQPSHAAAAACDMPRACSPAAAAAAAAASYSYSSCPSGSAPTHEPANHSDPDGVAPMVMDSDDE